MFCRPRNFFESVSFSLKRLARGEAALSCFCAVATVFEMENRAPHQTASSYYSPYSRQLTLLLPESSFHLVPDVERSGLEWFDVRVFEMMEAVGNRDQDVPSSPVSDIAEKMLNSQDADFTVPSTPVDLKLQDMVAASDLTYAQKPSPQVMQIVPLLDKKAPKISTGKQQKVIRKQNVGKE